MKYVTATLSCGVMDSLRSLKYIHDYTDDGFVLHGTAGWIPVNDLFEYLLLGEESQSEEEAEETITDNPSPF